MENLAKTIKLLLLFSSALLLFSSCKKDPPIVPEPAPTYYSFQGKIGANDNSTIVSIDHNLLICGNSGDSLCILKISKTGSQIWRKDFTAGYGCSASGITQSTNQDIFICGSTLRNELNSKSDILLIKTNSNGDTLWTKTYGGREDDNWSYIITTNDSNLLICAISFGYTSESSCDIYLIKANTNGDTIWTRTFLEEGQEIPYHLLQTQNGEYLVTGTNQDSVTGSELYLLKVSADGTQAWNKIIGPSRGKYGFSTVELSNGDLMTCGKGGLDQILLVKTDDRGNEYWEKEFGQDYLSEQGNAIQVNADGTFIITGGSYEPHSGQRGIVLLKVDQNGEQLFIKDFGHTFIDYGQNVLKDDNDDNIITGEYNGGIFMTRTDNNCVFK